MAYTAELIDIPPGRFPAVVTSLQMPARPAPRPDPIPAPWRLERLPQPDLARYRALFRRVGEPWLWSSRLMLDDAALATEIRDPAVEVHALQLGDADDGLLELDFRIADECELRFFGLAPSLIGTGAGRWLMNRALERVWSRPLRRFWVHTCTHDHPDAVGFYMRSGFVPYRRQLEIADDPRVSGVLPRTAAPHLPIV